MLSRPMTMTSVKLRHFHFHEAVVYRLLLIKPRILFVLTVCFGVTEMDAALAQLPPDLQNDPRVRNLVNQMYVRVVMVSVGMIRFSGILFRVGDKIYLQTPDINLDETTNLKIHFDYNSTRNLDEDVRRYQLLGNCKGQGKAIYRLYCKPGSLEDQTPDLSPLVVKIRNRSAHPRLRPQLGLVEFYNEGRRYRIHVTNIPENLTIKFSNGDEVSSSATTQCHGSSCGHILLEDHQVPAETKNMFQQPSLLNYTGGAAVVTISHPGGGPKTINTGRCLDIHKYRNIKPTADDGMYVVEHDAGRDDDSRGGCSLVFGKNDTTRHNIGYNSYMCMNVGVHEGNPVSAIGLIN